MVCEWGMADELGPVAYGQEDEPIFLGKEIARHKDYSEETARRIDQAVREILDRARGEAERIIFEQRVGLEAIADALLDQETLSDEEVREILNLPLLQEEKVMNEADNKPKRKARGKALDRQEEGTLDGENQENV